MLKIAILGLGGISDAHLPGWKDMEDATIVAACDIRPGQFEKLADVPTAKQYTDADEMLEKEEIDILDLCLPTYLHVEYACKAMERGINVICEKPVSLNEADIDMLYDTAKRNNVKFMVAQVIRFFPAYQAVKEMYETEKYGKLLSGNMHRLGVYPEWSWDNWYLDEARSGLVPFDLHIHDADFIVYAFGEPKKVIPHRSKRPDQDYLSATYEYDGFFINAEAAWYAAPYPFQFGFRFQFERALAVYLDGKLTVYVKNGDIVSENDEIGKEKVINLPSTSAYIDEICYFADCVINDKPVEKVTPESLKTVIKILHTIK